MLPYFTGEVEESPRPFFFYFSDDGDVIAIRFGDWKMTLMEQRAKQLAAWIEPFVPLRIPHIFHLRRDPFERALENSNTYYDWMMSHAFLLYEMQAIVAGQIEEFVKFPPRQKPASFNLDAVMAQLEDRNGKRPPLALGLGFGELLGVRRRTDRGSDDRGRLRVRPVRSRRRRDRPRRRVRRPRPTQSHRQRNCTSRASSACWTFASRTPALDCDESWTSSVGRFA